MQEDGDFDSVSRVIELIFVGFVLPAYPAVMALRLLLHAAGRLTGTTL
jgi:hypothetical protein